MKDRKREKRSGKRMAEERERERREGNYFPFFERERGRGADVVAKDGKGRRKKVRRNVRSDREEWQARELEK